MVGKFVVYIDNIVIFCCNIIKNGVFIVIYSGKII